MELLGKMVFWDGVAEPVEIKFAQDKIKALGLDPRSARDVSDRNAFIRAVRAAEEKRLVRRVGDEDASTLRFQFTAEALAKGGERLDYRYEAVVTYWKDTGKLGCDEPGVLALVQEKLGYSSTHYLPRDITAIVQRIFRREADLLPLRERGSVYFVPERYARVVERVSTFLSRCGGQLSTLAVPKSDRGSKKTIYAAFVQDANDALQKLNSAIDTATETTRQTNSRMREIKKLLTRTEVYEETLTSAATEIREGIEKARKRVMGVLA